MESTNSVLFSIGIPAYKSIFLKECISSILSQSYARFELIIVNDCSPEPLEEIIFSFKDERIFYFKNDKNIGAEHVVDNWNNCLNKASGDYFILMGDDDKMEPDYLEEFLKLILKYPQLEVYHCRSKIINEKSEPYLLTPSWPEYESVYDNMWHRLNNYRIQFISDFVYRTTTLKNNGGFFKLPLAWASDDISSYIACCETGIAHTNKPLLNYRRSRFNITSVGSNELKMKAILMEENWYDEFLKSPPDNLQDKILYNDLCKTFKKNIRKKKIVTVAESLQKNFFKGSSEWLNKRRNYKISFTEFAFSIFQAFKFRVLRKKT